MSDKTENRIYRLFICDYEISYSFVYSETKRFFKGYVQEANGTDADLCITPEYMEENRWLVSSKTKSAALEYHTLMLATGTRLLHVGRALFHGVSFIWKEHAWILTGISGVGKTTQLKYWLQQWPDEITVINGDKTSIYCTPNGPVWAGSSPWEGKEHVGTPGKCCRLGGIVLLEQGMENQIRQISPAEAVYPLFIEFISLPETEEEIYFQGNILEQIIREVPVWRLINRGDKDAAELTRCTFDFYLREQNENSDTADNMLHCEPRRQQE